MALGSLAFVLPFEPLRPVLRALGLELTLLELVAAAAAAVVFATRAGRVAHALGRLPLAFLVAFAAANLLSAAFAPADAGLAAKFALRTVAAATLAVAVAAAPHRARRVALAGFDA